MTAAPLPADGVKWAGEWIAFGPVDKNDPVLQGEQLRSIPERLVMPETPLLPRREFLPQRVSVRPGAPYDLSHVMGVEPGVNPDRVRRVAYVFVELESPAADELELGFGADWWLQLWVNGEEVFSNVEGNEGNNASPISILNHSRKVRLREGRNLLVARVMGGTDSALTALGDASMVAVAEQQLKERENKRRFNILPPFEGRIVFPLEDQAIATAAMTVDFPEPDGDLASGSLMGLRRMPVRQSVLGRDDRPGARLEVMDTEYPAFPGEPVRLLLSKHRYPSEDLHLDAVVWVTPPEGEPRQGELLIRLLDASGGVLAENRIDANSATGWFFSVGFPPQLLKGGKGELDVIWLRDGKEVGRASDWFDVVAPTGVATSGRVPIGVINRPGATVGGAPITVGIPFPRGALADAAHVRLVDENGKEVPVQTKVTSRWSRYGSIRWLLCDFTVDLAGAGRQLYLEYGPQVSPVMRPAIEVSGAGRGFPQMDLGRLRIDSAGLSLNGTPVLSPEIWHGAFVEHEDGRIFRVDPNAAYAIEEHGAEKVVVRRTGWYRDAATGDKFCNYVTRFILMRDSPIVRVFHTWIFTGDGNRDRIRDMGWRFDTRGKLRPEGILTAIEDGSPQWANDRYLVQYDYQHYRLSGDSEPWQGRTPGVLAADAAGAGVFFGVKDFWQRFPNELEFGPSWFTFYNWPSHNPPASHESPISRRTAFLHRYAHEGEVLDFRLPDEYAEAPIWTEMIGREKHWEEGRPETANAQGIARTEEFFLYLAPSTVDWDAGALVLDGLINETLRAVVDPEWVAASEVFGKIHYQDYANFPEEETIYAEVVRAPSRWNERLGFYGKWLYGEVPGWSINLEDRTVSLYRALRKNHHGWPIPWTPYARSGDPELLRIAEAATRQQTDISFCHYASAEVDEAVGPNHYRAQGWWLRGLLPWGGGVGPAGRNYTVDSDYIWDAYYLTGYTRARDVALLFGEVTKNDYHTTLGPRTTNSTLASYVDMYQATFDPWFLVAAHNTAALHRELAWGQLEEEIDKTTHQLAGHFWRPSEQSFERFTGHRDHRLAARNNAVSYASPRTFISSWSRLSVPFLTQAAYAYEVTGDPFFLGRVEAHLDVARDAVYMGDLDYARGTYTIGGTTRGIFTGWYIRQFPLGLGALARAGQRTESVPNPWFVQGTTTSETVDGVDCLKFTLPTVFVRKDAGTPVRLMLSARTAASGGEIVYRYRIASADGKHVREGNWAGDRDEFVELDDTLPAGTYKVTMFGVVAKTGNAEEDSRMARRFGSVLFPYSEDPYTPEVIRLETARGDGWAIPGGSPLVHCWFRIPAGVDSIWINVPGSGSDLGKAAIRNTDGDAVWSLDSDSATKVPSQRIEIPVTPDMVGQLWQLTGSGFVLDPRIEPYVSVGKQQWFLPQE